MTLILPADHLERTDAWGRATQVMDYVYRPSTFEDLKRTFELARQAGVSLGLRGAGRSYGDASLNSEGMLVDLSRMSRILEWDPKSGVVTAEPGVTIEQLWRHTIGDGWWPPVVPGTMFPSLGGCLAMNIHGKDNWHAGTLGDYVLSFEALLGSGDVVTVTPESDPELFYGMIGGLGMLGCFTGIQLQMKRIHSGRVKVLALSSANMRSMLADMEALKDDWQFVVGWVDGIAGGRALGRGQIHVARYLEPGEDPSPAQGLRLDSQDLPDTFFGVVPKSVLWRFLHPFGNNLGMRLINLGRYWMARRNHGHAFEQSLTEFDFLLDYVPNWKRAYLPQGLIQFQCFVPSAEAAEAFEAVLRRCQSARLPPYLGVAKRHRPDNFLLTHAVDGYSLALDFRVTRTNRGRLEDLTEALDRIVLDHHGRFYFAKDSTLAPSTAMDFLGRVNIERFLRLKARCDPEGRLQTNLWRRVFAPLIAREEFHKIAPRSLQSGQRLAAAESAA